MWLLRRCNRQGGRLVAERIWATAPTSHLGSWCDRVVFRQLRAGHTLSCYRQWTAEGCLKSVFGDSSGLRLQCKQWFSSKKADSGSHNEDQDEGANKEVDFNPSNDDQYLQSDSNIVFQVIKGNLMQKKRIGRQATGGKIRRLPIPIKEDAGTPNYGDSATGARFDGDSVDSGDKEAENAEVVTGSITPENREISNLEQTNDNEETIVYQVVEEVTAARTDDDQGDSSSDGNTLLSDGDATRTVPQLRLPILHSHSTNRHHALPALAMFQKPAFPGFYQVLQIQDQSVLQFLSNMKQNAGSDYVGGFLTKEQKSKDMNSSPFPVLRDDAGAVLSHEELHVYGTLLQVITITPHLSLQGGQVILMPHRRIKMTGIYAEPSENHPLYRVSIDYVDDDLKNFEDSQVTKALQLEIIATVKELIKTSNFYKEHFDHIIRIYNLDNPSRIADLIAGISMAQRDQLQQILAEVNIDKRLAMVLEVAKNDLEFAKVQADVKTQIEEKMSREQRRYILTEQMKMIRKELGLDTDDKNTVVEGFEADYDKVSKFMSKEAQDSYRNGISRLKQLEPASAEYGVCRSHLEWLLGMPWGKFTKDSRDIQNAKLIFDKHHFGLKDVKTRLMEYMATSILKGKSNGKIICLVGPPGVGKTSIANAVAEVLGRKLYRFSLGGLFDVSELRGHRRTYVGALPGKFVQALKYTQSMNPLIVLDEIDKLGRDARGDPASALLEVLDPSQNEHFRDYYLDIPVDLSHTLFLCTANAVDTIPGPLIDRMEIISIPGYLPEEKLEIARSYLIPQTLESTGLTSDVVELPENTINTIIKHYSREAGVRSLLRCIEKIYRKVALKVVMDNSVKLDLEDNETSELVATTHGSRCLMQKQVPLGHREESEALETTSAVPSESGARCTSKLLDEVEKIVISEGDLKCYLGVPVYTKEALHPYPLPYGVVMGLAWTNAGGATMYVEARGQMIDKRGNMIEPNRKSIAELQDDVAVYQDIVDGERNIGTFHGTMKVTGHLGNVMTESSQIALTYCKTFVRKHQPRNMFLDEAHIHVHVPEGATPKDGPSGGITMASSLVSLAMKKRIKPHLAMTGELTLSGKVLRVGGIKEKLIAAIREGVETVVLPVTNEADVSELEESITSKLNIVYVDSYDDVYAAVFEHN